MRSLKRLVNLLNESSKLPDANYTVKDGVLLEVDRNVSGKFIIPHDVHHIDDEAFMGCRSITDIEIGNNVKSIGETVFVGCGLKVINIPVNVSSISEYAFYKCETLRKVMFFSSSQTVPVCCFADCDNLQYFKFPNDWEGEIESMAFVNCFSLRSINLPSRLYSIGREAFANCGSLETIRIPGSVEKIGSRAFADCIRLSSLVLEDGIKEINHNAFNGCKSLTTIELPNSVEYVGYKAFWDCDSLKKVYMPSNTRYDFWEDDAFSDTVKIVRR